MNTNLKCNIAHYIPLLAQKYSDTPAIIYKKNGSYHECSFAQIQHLTNVYAAGFSDQGIKKGTRVIMLVPHSLDFYLVMFALFKIGAVPIVVDPGMHKKDMLICIKEAEAEAIIGIPFAFLLKSIFRKYFKSCKIFIIVGKKQIWKGIALSEIKNKYNTAHDILVDTFEDDLAAILFTSGSTGIAKGVEYEHGMFNQQVLSIQKLYGLKPGQKDLPCFPLFGLFSLAIGITLILPDINPAKPASVNPCKITEPILKFGITNCFASPAIWKNVSLYCEHLKITLPTLKIALAAGAPIAGHIIQRLCNGILPKEGNIYTPYGATESLPVASIGGRERLLNTQQKTNEGGGICVGKPLAEVNVKIIKITEEAITTWNDSAELPNGQIGEIIVNSKATTKNYFRKPEKTKMSKIFDGKLLWHRMGDVGYLDSEGALWFCGRKDHRIILPNNEVLFSIPCESVFNEHDKVSRSALVKGRKVIDFHEPILIIELNSEHWSKKSHRLAEEILRLGQKYSHTKLIRKALFFKRLPVDIRHNAKINREWLGAWAQKQSSFFEIKI